ncbi:hypothetical protein LEP1GSC036_2110 [Leptospira weilii str. 2006001853]|uniref:Uncharacterized protein n=1 Tax=Leptospira weilii str. 2006001853 TaxID=1001589 RepID=A0A828Z1T7_9LEPT|nr:hypothetical protein LEP1GSC036_2110 [Leptospira weilii str. 2006001853]EMJ62863.1 hypothetical protein LEP1GSC051_3486 [Leptospira sp. P2653]EMN42639.1 hypothetical protein LEP1GSC086_1566 [Leptospira weilii str. LNT 1234]
MIDSSSPVLIEKFSSDKNQNILRKLFEPKKNRYFKKILYPNKKK